jgi:type IV pilus assembly protein PilQ
MSNQDHNRTFTSNLLAMSLRCGIMPSLAISMIAGSAQAQDSGGFGLLAALKNQAKASAQEVAPEEGDFTGMLDDPMDDGFAEEFADPDQGSAPSDDDLSDLAGAVEVSDYDLVDLHVNNEDLGNILQLLSIQSQRNIISSNNVQATVTADLYGVTFYEALDSILHVNGYGYIEKGNFIYVYTADELAEFEALSRQPITKIITLDYLNATDAGEFAKMLLSENGSITTNAQTEAFTITDGVPSGADNYANSATMVINDYEENIDEIIALIAELDTKPAQILVEATILQTTLNEANAFGMDFALIQNLDFTDFVGTGGPLSVVDGLISGSGKTVDGTKVDAPAAGGHGTALNSTTGNTSGPSTLKAGFVNGDVGVFLRVLDEVTDVTVVSNPKLLTLNRQPARVLVGTRVGYLNSTSTQTSTTQSVQFLDVGTQLSVRPFVSKNGLIRLELRPQVSSFTLRQVSDNTGSNVTIPDEDTTEMNTNVMVRDGQTVVLGGLFTESTSSARRSVPLLGDIPLIGNAFKGYDDQTRRSEIIFLITPSIVNDTILTETGKMGNQYLEHARYGARKGLLPWSRERRVGQLLISAREHADQGHLEEALSKVDRALRLMPVSPDARALRTELTEKVRTMPSRSLIEGIYHNELHYGGKSTSLVEPNTVNPFVSGTAPESGVATTAEPSNDSNFDPSSDNDFQPDPSFESEPIVEVPTDTVSDTSFQMEPTPQDETFVESTSVAAETNETGTDEGFVEVAVDEPSINGTPDTDASATESVDGDSTQASASTTEPSTEPSSEFDMMKSIVTGEDTAVEFTQIDPSSFQNQEHELTTADQPLAPLVDEPQPMGSSFSVAAEKFSGQLIIPLPSGGALRLDWPLSFDFVAKPTPSSETSEATFTEVPTDGDDFSDMND